MLRLILLLVVLGLILPAASSVPGEGNPISVRVDVTDDSYRLFPGYVQFPSATEGEQIVGYRNVTVEDFTSWRVRESGIDRIKALLESSFQEDIAGELSYGLSQEGIKVRYTPATADGSRFQELVATVPARVNGEVAMESQEFQASIPVKIVKTDQDSLRKTAIITAKSTHSSFDSRTGDSYREDFRVLETFTVGRGQRVRNVSRGGKSVDFEGYIKMPSPCHRLNRDYTEIDKGMIVRIKPVLPEENSGCIRLNATKRYRISLASDSPFKLRIQQNGRELRVVETRGYSRLPGLLERFLDLFRNFV